ncbi:hypothetical protein J0S82_012387 [Galemys pyrenaicus]|uniref:Uncharacterized protein n=1 Tax=Galemys pyrenaicus TaxID=202257 RepID=A0A8J6A4U3_GALPY|nr:hypothetical protein J0S82_012387 [Galemys pyrenaicus]
MNEFIQGHRLSKEKRLTVAPPGLVRCTEQMLQPVHSRVPELSLQAGRSKAGPAAFRATLCPPLAFLLCEPPLQLSPEAPTLPTSVHEDVGTWLGPTLQPSF